jgi:two-component system OmpR family response regulator
MSALNVLYVDDEPFVREVATISLEMDPRMTVHAVASGPEALAALEDGLRPDVVLLDVMMPQMDGPATLERLRAIPGCEALPVIFLTARAQPSDREPLTRLDVVGVLVKPFDPKTLAADVRALVP